MTPFLADDLRADEGLRLGSYPDPLTGAAPWTIGYGHTGPGVYPGLIITQGRADELLTQDIAKAVALCDAYIPWWRKLDDVRQDILAEMMFNMGWDDLRTVKHEGLSGFINTLGYVRVGAYGLAAGGMLQSAWAKEVGHRATRLAQQMRTGVRA